MAFWFAIRRICAESKIQPKRFRDSKHPQRVRISTSQSYLTSSTFKTSWNHFRIKIKNESNLKYCYFVASKLLLRLLLLNYPTIRPSIQGAKWNFASKQILKIPQSDRPSHRPPWRGKNRIKLVTNSLSQGTMMMMMEGAVAMVNWKRVRHCSVQRVLYSYQVLNRTVSALVRGSKSLSILLLRLF